MRKAALLRPKVKMLAWLSACLLVILLPAEAQQTDTFHIPLPSKPQLRWQKYERIMFVHFNPTTWTGKEYDDHTLPLSRMNPYLLNTDQWCEVARSWGAKMILFVAKHTGGFCWWQTNTTDYCVRNIPWRNGKGDVLADLSASCRKYGLGLGVYIYPGDDNWGAGIGSGGRTKDPAKQEAYNKVFRQQLTEVLTKYGPMQEVWFDGSCVIDVSDILKEYASDAVIFQGPQATIRWVGNEDGIAPYPNWYTLKSSDVRTGVATALHSDPDGDAYAPVEVDLPLLKNGGHKWFWAPNTDHLLLNVDQLMDIYYKSAGRGAVMLLNSTPDTTGLIPASHAKIYKAFGEEIRRRFEKPIKTISGEGYEFIMAFNKPVSINHAIIREDIAKGQRIRAYVLEGYANNAWIKLCEGSSVGTMKIDPFPEKRLEKVRLRITEAKARPVLSSFSVYDVRGYETTGLSSGSENRTITIGSWDANTFTDEWKEMIFDLTPYVDHIGQYEISFRMVTCDWSKDWGLEFKDWDVEMYGRMLPEAVERVGNSWTFRITRSQQTDKPDDFPTRFHVSIRSKPGRTVGTIDFRRIRY